jgi:hypothetical protein
MSGQNQGPDSDSSHTVGLQGRRNLLPTLLARAWALRLGDDGQVTSPAHPWATLAGPVVTQQDMSAAELVKELCGSVWHCVLTT